MRSTQFALALVALILSFVTLASAQAAAGGGAGVLTTYTGVQIISGYTPPPSTQLPAPQVSRGTILTTIPGYGNGSNAAQNQGSSGSSSGAMSLLDSRSFLSRVAGSATVMGVAVVAGAMLL
ncbi:hypothetical protein PSEUBRA_003231 [Kalmanozyma brasiliensis GHG001]|uniref:Uncharacterized protein n=1 Tax=Kalmanozyma brasiliensis (strain GHG001) TaxID=1365824 RepID=V5EQI7_KALBG|nr:uncharacterized protein PSEUBRA_003231 [Kalmanozyma brasiliensis GHG001]EST07405.1 hypothetical protein PSEUBRA_003231 [Kalmanozyma brasiliensis GHG001]